MHLLFLDPEGNGPIESVIFSSVSSFSQKTTLTSDGNAIFGQTRSIKMQEFPGLRPRPRGGGAYSAPQSPPAVFSLASLGRLASLRSALPPQHFCHPPICPPNTFLLATGLLKLLNHKKKIVIQKLNWVTATE